MKYTGWVIPLALVLYILIARRVNQNRSFQRSCVPSSWHLAHGAQLRLDGRSYVPISSHDSSRPTRVNAYALECFSCGHWCCRSAAGSSSLGWLSLFFDIQR